MVKRRRKPKTFTFSPRIYNSFKRYCEDNEIVMSREIERMMKKRLRRGRRRF